MAYPPKQRAEDPNAESRIASVGRPVVDKVSTPRASASGGAPKIREWWQEAEAKLAQSYGNRLVNAQPAPWKLDDIISQRGPLVEALKEKLTQRSQARRGGRGDPDAYFWDRVKLAPEAVAAAMIRRMYVNAARAQEAPPEWVQDTRMLEPEYEAVRRQDLYRLVSAIRSLNGRS